LSTTGPGRGGRLDGKVAIVTGAARGMGAATARAFVAEGARVVLVDRRDDLGDELAGELGEAAVYESADVTEEAAWSRIAASAEEHFGGVDVLVNNAGIIRV
jgi:3alpha(or 20beta)-hydroxysteroid dehydrogenase